MSSGEAHFLNLAPGNYVVTVDAAGIHHLPQRRGARRRASSVPLRATLQVAGVTETVQVNVEAPIVDPARQTVTTGVSYEELQQLPSARDPWVILQTVPGVVVDRVNVGGAESGQQSNYLAKGAGLAENTWNLDGIPVTDLAATGSSPTYYNFDMFQEMSVTTGGASATNPTAGVQLNMQFKTGANRRERRGASATAPVRACRATIFPTISSISRAQAARATASRISPTTASTSAARSCATSGGRGARTGAPRARCSR